MNVHQAFVGFIADITFAIVAAVASTSKRALGVGACRINIAIV